MIRNQTDTIVIKPRTPRALVVSLIGIALVVFACSVAGAYYFGRWEVTEQVEKIQIELDNQKQKYMVLSERHDRMQETFVQMKRQLHIDDSAYSALRDELEQSSRQLAELGRELKFYRSIISPEEGQEGVRVQEIVVAPTESSGRYKYRVVLIQTLQQGKELSAVVGFTIKGKNGETPQVIRHPAEDSARMRVKFKYFQNLSGTLELPPEFVPEEVRVHLVKDKKKDLLEERWYLWADISSVKTS